MDSTKDPKINGQFTSPFKATKPKYMYPTTWKQTMVSRFKFWLPLRTTVPEDPFDMTTNFNYLSLYETGLNQLDKLNAFPHNDTL